VRKSVDLKMGKKRMPEAFGPAKAV